MSGTNGAYRWLPVYEGRTNKGENECFSPIRIKARHVTQWYSDIKMARDRQWAQSARHVFHENRGWNPGTRWKRVGRSRQLNGNVTVIWLCVKASGPLNGWCAFRFRHCLCSQSAAGRQALIIRSYRATREIGDNAEDSQVRWIYKSVTFFSSFDSFTISRDRVFYFFLLFAISTIVIFDRSLWQSSCHFFIICKLQLFCDN